MEDFYSDYVVVQRAQSSVDDNLGSITNSAIRSVA